jgi:hypothetical protein
MSNVSIDPMPICQEIKLYGCNSIKLGDKIDDVIMTSVESGRHKLLDVWIWANIHDSNFSMSDTNLGLVVQGLCWCNS